MFRALSLGFRISDLGFGIKAFMSVGELGPKKVGTGNMRKYKP